MVLEYGDIDLARLLAKHEQARREGGSAEDLDENFIRLYWQQMLQVSSVLLPFESYLNLFHSRYAHPRSSLFMVNLLCTSPTCLKSVLSAAGMSHIQHA